MKKPSEYDKFETTMRHLLAVPHSELKAKLDEEKKVKQRKKTRKSSGSRAAT